jgi:probable F420-dependent oxidoreductase
MKFWQNISWSETEQMLDVARFAEECGYEGVMNGDHGIHPHNMKTPYYGTADGVAPMQPGWEYPDCWVAGTAICLATKKLKFCSCIYVLPIRNPYDVARATGTGAILTGNRIVVGVGAGWMKDEFDAFGVDFATRGKRLDEFIEVLRKIWKAGGGAVEHHGTFFDFDPLHISPGPGYSLPIWNGGASKAAQRRAAYLCDGYIGDGHSPEQAFELLATMKQMRKDAGRANEPFEMVIPLTTPPDIDTLKRLEDAGMTGTVAYPFLFTVGKLKTTLDEKKQAMEQYAEGIMRKMGA